MSTITPYLNLEMPGSDDNISPVPYNNNFMTIDSAINSLKTDYVVATGVNTTGGKYKWLWRRWNNGIAECWGIITVNYANAKVLQENPVPLPFTLSKGLYSVNGSISTQTGINNDEMLDVNAKIGPVESTTAVSNIGIVVHSKSGTFKTNQTMRVYVSVVGRWK